MIPYFGQWRPSLRATIGTVMTALIALTGTVVLALTYIESRGALLSFSEQLVDQVAQGTVHELHRFLKVARRGTELTRRLADEGVIDLDDPSQAEALFFNVLKTSPTVTSMAYGRADGTFIMVRRASDGALDTKLIEAAWTGWRRRTPDTTLPNFQLEPLPGDAFDPRTRPWYAHWATRPRGPGDERVHWTEVYIFHTEGAPGITASLPLRGADGALKGVISVDIGLTALSSFLGHQRIGRNGIAFVVDGRGRLVAAPSLNTATTRSQLKLPTLQESALPALVSLSKHPAMRDAFRSGPEDGTFSFDHDGRGHLATLVPVASAFDQGWLVGVVVPEEDILGQVQEGMGQTIWIIGAVLLIAFAIALLLASVVSRNLQRLSVESGRIKALTFGSGASPNAGFREIHQVLTAFEDMKSGLRAFERYVPAELVRLLLKHRVEPKLGGEERELTLLFSDIAGFTSLSEGMSPTRVARSLGNYLSAMTRELQSDRSGGIVDKYVGDGIMAFWGAPQPVVDHPTRACEAALRALAAVEALKAADPRFPDYRTRIGLHTDRVVVGNFGSNERLSYTAIGDGVNLASRLEGLNKIYGTQIIITDAVRDRLDGRFLTRRLDRVAVRGRAKGLFIHELLCLRADADEGLVATIDTYEHALECYLGRRWAEAHQRFSHAAALRGGDAPSEAMLDRCAAFQAVPPPMSWAGLNVVSTK